VLSIPAIGARMRDPRICFQVEPGSTQCISSSFSRTTILLDPVLVIRKNTFDTAAFQGIHLRNYQEGTMMAGRAPFLQGWQYRVTAIVLFSLLSVTTLASAQTNIFPPTGNAGVGTTTPTRRLDVVGNLAVTPTTGQTFLLDTDTSGPYMGTGTNTAFSFITNFSRRMLIDTDGNVGIGSTTPARRLDVVGNFAVTPASGQTFVLDSDSSGPYMGTTTNTAFSFVTNFARRLLIDTNGNVGIGTSNPTALLHVVGDAIIDGNIAAKYQDVAEWVPTTTRISPGTVVVIDALNGTRVLPAAEPYDTRVAGVVSAKPGILLGEPGDDKVSVAHSGRVKVKADARYGAIAVGDMLVSSATLGFARRSTPIEVNGIAMHRPGTILGKALEPLKEGTGEILVLLTLQ